MKDKPPTNAGSETVLRTLLVLRDDRQAPGFECLGFKSAAQRQKKAVESIRKASPSGHACVRRTLGSGRSSFAYLPFERNWVKRTHFGASDESLSSIFTSVSSISTMPGYSRISVAVLLAV